MAAKHLASDAVKKGMSIRKAAKTFGIPPSTLCDHLAIINRIQNCTKEQTEGLITSAVNAVAAGCLPANRAARVYGIAEKTVRKALTKKAADMRAKRAFKTINKVIVPKIALEKKSVGRPRKAKVDLA